MTLSFLNTPIRYGKGIGEKKAHLFEKLGIKSVYDLFWHFPNYYEDRSHIVPISRITPGKRQVIQGEVILLNQKRIRPNLSLLRVAIRDKSGILYALWYNQDWLINVLKKGKKIVVGGRVKYGRELREINVEDFEILSGDKEDALHLKRIVPIYPLTEGISQRTMRRIIKMNLKEKLPYLKDYLPSQLKAKYNLIPLKEALLNIHFPRDFPLQAKARRRLVFDEFFLLELALALKKARERREKGISFRTGGELVRKFISSLPFSLTLAQKRVIKEILTDMKSPFPMRRLLQGDVGSGKTVVAVVALLTAVENDFQAALMAPTEILAQQHYFSLKEFLKSVGITPHLLVSELASGEKKKTLEEVARGEAKLVVGTHALIQEGVKFQKLGMVVIDEQHRFGVIQRSLLPQKGISPDVLVMSATPIPRSLALTLHGDLDLSVIDELPPGRKPVITRWVGEGKRKEVYEFVKREIRKGRQVYFVYPLIEESEVLEVKAAQEMVENLRKFFPEFRVELLHGRMKRGKKEKVMKRLREKEIDILISTTVIEVGIDIPNATLMVVENAERFGLAQIHQLRGRVGRGGEKSFCFLITGKNITEEGIKRMKVLIHTNDGFRVAEEDLKIRGPGEFFGTRQAGEFTLRIADLTKDAKVLYFARKEAFNLTQEDPSLSEYPLLKEILTSWFRGRVEIS